MVSSCGMESHGSMVEATSIIKPKSGGDTTSRDSRPPRFISVTHVVQGWRV